MDELKNFRITLQLTHFYQDHRSICKIFINKKMKHIRDLEDHIRSIFELSDFYLMSNGHYVPPSEDVRILRPDEIVIALPLSPHITPLCASTPAQTDICSSLMKGKRKWNPTEEKTKICVDSGKPEEDVTSPKKIKKRKKEKLKYDERKQIDNDYVEHVRSKKCKRQHQTRDPETENEAKTDLTNSVKKKILYYENQKRELKNLSDAKVGTDDIIETPKKDEELLVKGTDYLKNKKLFVQKQNNVISYDLPKKSNIVKNIVIAKGVNNIDSNLPSNQIIPNVVSAGFNKVELEKATRLNKSLVENVFKANPSKKIKTDVNKLTQSLHLGKDNTIKENTFSTIKVVENKLITPPRNLNVIRNSIDLKPQSKADVNRQLMLYLCNEKGEIIEQNTSSTISVAANEIVIPFKDVSALQDCNSNMIQEFPSNDAAKVPLANDKIDGIDSEQPLEYINKVDNISGIESSDTNNQTRITENDSAINLGCDLGKLIYPSENSFSEKECSELNDLTSGSSAVFEYTKFAEPTSFITKRKRKRSHSKRKTKSSFENLAVPPKRPSFREKRILWRSSGDGTHIKFDDDGEAIKINGRDSDKSTTGKKEETHFETEQISNLDLYTIEIDSSARTSCSSTNEIGLNVEKSEVIEQQKAASSIMTLDSTSASYIADVTLPSNFPSISLGNSLAHTKATALKTTKDDDNCTHLIGKSIELETLQKGLEGNKINEQNGETDDGTSSGIPLISQYTVLKSPLMVSLKPKSRDIIAFKVLRLTDNYTPEVSNYIIGEVVYFSESDSNVEIKIIDGFDQFIEPDGKFSLEEEEQALSKTKSYSWSNIIEPRLIYP